MRTVECPPSPQAENDWLRPLEDAALLVCPGSVQERFTVALLRHTGLRVSEASSVTLADLVLEPGQEALLVRRSKTAAGRRSVPILPCGVRKVGSGGVAVFRDESTKAVAPVHVA
jgi:hypothetical protein